MYLIISFKKKPELVNLRTKLRYYTYKLITTEKLDILLKKKNNILDSHKNIVWICIKNILHVYLYIKC